MSLLTFIKMKIFIVLVFSVFATIDLNLSELKYLADHLLPEECRRLVAAAHFKSYMQPNALDQAERAIPKDVSCLDLLLHWNSEEGEGKGETHEVLEHRLRQMGKYELADWLGKTVFHQLGVDLEKSLDTGLHDLVDETSVLQQNILLPTLVPVIEYEDPTNWLAFDTICFIALAALIVTLIALCTYLIFLKAYTKFKNQNRRKSKKSQYYEMVEDYSGSESEDKFDVRQHETAM